jgi:hypothetical protein
MHKAPASNVIIGSAGTFHMGQGRHRSIDKLAEAFLHRSTAVAAAGPDAEPAVSCLLAVPAHL